MLLGCLAGCGGVEQTMTIKTNPPGALVYLNDQEVGRTPVTRDFLWHGNYDVEIRKDGYEPLKTHKWVVAPAYNWIPFDFLIDIFPIHLHEQRTLSFTLTPTKPTAENPELMMARAEEMRAQLQASQYTPKPTTRPAAKPPTTQPSRG